MSDIQIVNAVSAKELASGQVKPGMRFAFKGRAESMEYKDTQYGTSIRFIGPGMMGVLISDDGEVVSVQKGKSMFLPGSAISGVIEEAFNAAGENPSIGFEVKAEAIEDASQKSGYRWKCTIDGELELETPEMKELQALAGSFGKRALPAPPKPETKETTTPKK